MFTIEPWVASRGPLRSRAEWLAWLDVVAHLLSLFPRRLVPFRAQPGLQRPTVPVICGRNTWWATAAAPASVLPQVASENAHAALRVSPPRRLHRARDRAR